MWSAVWVFVFGAATMILPSASHPKLFVVLYLLTLLSSALACFMWSTWGFSRFAPEQCDDEFELNFALAGVNRQISHRLVPGDGCPPFALDPS